MFHSILCNEFFMLNISRHSRKFGTHSHNIWDIFIFLLANDITSNFAHFHRTTLSLSLVSNCYRVEAMANIKIHLSSHTCVLKSRKWFAWRTFIMLVVNLWHVYIQIMMMIMIIHVKNTLNNGIKRFLCKYLNSGTNIDCCWAATYCYEIRGAEWKGQHFTLHKR